MLQPYEILLSDIIEVDEPIDPKYLSLLVQTHFKVNKPFRHLFALYVPNAKAYCVIASNDPSKQFFAEPQILENTLNDSRYLLCITPYYYALFYEKKFIYMKKFEKNIQIEDIKLYLMQKLAINDLQIVVFNKEEYDGISKDFSTITPLKTLAVPHCIKPYLYYLSYTIVVFVLTFYYLNKPIQTKSVKEFDIQDISNTYYLTPRLVQLLDLLQKQEISMEHLSYKNKRIIAKIKSQKISNIYNLAKKINHSVNIKYIQYDENSAMYHSLIEFSDV